ncbi:TIGR04222 domain-containing membrane protein [Streptomyces uncialis]|uniref:TIGR04222 domain-containing membrane protein n=1 Tax=Streptomyces uncialis TaxID=1048205 RepID=UPI0036534333
MWLGLAVGAWILLVGAALGRSRARRRLRRFPVAERERRTAVPVHAYAFLCGGRRRTAQTAMTALYLAGLIEVRRGRIVRTGAHHDVPDPDPVAVAALAACRPGRPERPRGVERRTKRSAPVSRIGDSLARDGLVTHPGLLARIEAWERAMLLAAFFSAFLAMTALMVWDVRRSDQAGLAAAVAAPPGALAMAVLARTRPLPNGPTSEGRRAIEEQPLPPREDGPHARTLHGVASDGPRSPLMPDGLARVLRRSEPSAWQPDDPAGLGGL